MKRMPDHSQLLQKLLKIKRYEQPPPSHFDRMARHIFSELAAPSPAPAAWWDRWLPSFRPQPVFAGAYAFAVGTLLIVGFGASHWVEADGSHANAHLPAYAGPWLGHSPVPSGTFPYRPDAATARTTSSLRPTLGVTELAGADNWPQPSVLRAGFAPATTTGHWRIHPALHSATVYGAR